MEVMFWVWLGVIVVTAIIEFATVELVSIWFTLGAIPSFIMSAIGGVAWEIQIVVFFCVSALMIVSLRSVTKKFLLKNANEKTNVDSLIGKDFRLIEGTDFEHLGSVKVNGVVWSAIGEKGEKINNGELVRVVRVEGNKLIVKRTEKEEKQAKNSELIVGDENANVGKVKAKQIEEVEKTFTKAKKPAKAKKKEEK